MWPALIPGLFSIIEKFLPEDPTKKAEAQQEIVTLMTQQEFELAKAQVEVNKVEASNSNIFVAGWRPASGWICVVALAIGAIIKILIPAIIVLLGTLKAVDTETVANIATALIQLKEIDTELFTTLLYGLLGLGTLRTFEKVKGKAS